MPIDVMKHRDNVPVTDSNTVQSYGPCNFKSVNQLHPHNLGEGRSFIGTIVILSISRSLASTAPGKLPVC